MLKDILVQDYPMVFKDSVVMLNGEPFYILSFEGIWAECLNINTQEYDTVDFREFTDIRIPNAGYFNYRGVCCYISRYPARKFKHGLSMENIKILTHPTPSAVIGIKIKDCKDQAMYMKAKSLYHMFKNQYPSLEQAYLLSKKTGNFITAFDRQFAVDKNGTVYYKTKSVGIKIGDKVLLDNENQHLKIALPKECQ